MPAASTDERRAPRRTLVAGVGYHNLRDHSFGPVLIERLQREGWPAGVEFEDLSYGPIGVMHNLDERPPYDRMILMGGVARGRPAGAVHSYRWDGRLPSEDEIQARVAEAVTGVISLDNLLIIGTYFRKLAPEVFVIEVEPAGEGWGEGLTGVVESAVPAVVSEIRRLCES